MNKFLALALITISTLTSFGQNFEGKITYSNSYESKNLQITNQQWLSMMGNKQEFYIKNGDYKSVTNGTLMQWQLYVNADNKIYSKMSNSETVFWNDGLSNPDSIVNVQLNKNVIEILGYNCDELILTCKSGTQKYYFNSALMVNVKLFENHLFGNWYDFLKESKALPLKIIIDNSQFTMENIATGVEKIKLSKKDFQLPENVKTAKSPY
ncbi:hypothetical protein [Formosa sp. A9]|uniref:hypothetical protein n=1 Tax=Formosa sp. A9 TaxID=3442641 RepID=UPI003EBC6ED3